MRSEQLATNNLRIYSPDTIPLWELSSKRVLSHIGKTFGFEQFQNTQPDEKNLPPGLLFGRGRAPATDPAPPATIESLLIGHAQLVLSTRAPEGHRFNDAILAELRKVCDEVTPHSSWVDNHRVEVLQTTWVGHLDLTPENLIDPRVWGSLTSVLSGGANSGKRHVHSRGLSLRIATHSPRPELLELGLQIPDEDFKLEPRAGRLPEEKAWFSTSALRSEEHLQLLEDIERLYRK